jgi:hypothetical protein
VQGRIIPVADTLGRVFSSEKNIRIRLYGWPVSTLEEITYELVETRAENVRKVQRMSWLSGRGGLSTSIAGG